MVLTKEQLSEFMCKHAEKENGLHDLFYPQILAILRNQEEECEKLAGTLYTKGLTQSQVGEVFDEIYGEHYSKASISRMIDYVRKDVSEWLERPLDEYYPIVFIDCVYIKVHRRRSVASESFYVVLGVTEDGTREVLGIFNRPAESAQGWGEMLEDLRERGVKRVGLVVADGLSGLDKVISMVFPSTPRNDASYKTYFTYLNYSPRIQSMIYTTNWIERLQKDFRRVTRMRGAMPNEESVLVLMGKTAMDKSSYNRILPGITTDRTLFPSASTNDALDENVVCVYHGMK